MKGLLKKTSALVLSFVMSMSGCLTSTHREPCGVVISYIAIQSE